MGYDYFFMKGKPRAELQELAENTTSESLGTIDGVQAAIVALFPSLRWKKAPIPNVLAWFARAEVGEFQMIGGPSGQVMVLSMSRCERADVERVAKQLGLVAIDEQTLERFGG